MQMAVSKGICVPPVCRKKKQDGIVLILALILLVVISTAAVLAVRGAISGEKVSNNLRVSAVATQAAETGLRYCENLLLAGGAPVILMPLTAGVPMPTTWKTRANWTGGNISTVSADVANSSDSAGRTMTKRPLCMVEEMRLAPSEMATGTAYLITSRGFSQDYQTNSNGLVTAGSEVWMQSILRY